MADPLPLALLDALAGPEQGLDERIADAVGAHPAMAAALEPLGEMLIDASIDLVLQLHRHDQTITVRGKVGAFGCVLATPTEPGSSAGWWQAAGVTGAARLIAQTVGLGPRLLHRNAGRILPMPREALLAACGRTGFEEPVQKLIEAMTADGHPRRPLQAILSSDALFWHLGLHADGAVEAAMSLAVVDTEAHGLWLALDAPGGALLQSATPTGIWRALCHTLAVVPATMAFGDSQGSELRGIADEDGPPGQRQSRNPCEAQALHSSPSAAPKHCVPGARHPSGWGTK